MISSSISRRRGVWQRVLLAACIVLLSACAGTARGTKTSVYKTTASPPPAEQVQTIESRPEALVVIRYPAIINADAEHPFYQAFANQAIGGTVPIEVKVRTDTTRVAQAVIAKTNYFVMSLYHELQKELPEHSVLLSPHMIVWDRDTGLSSRPMLASEQVPSVLTIDFGVYSFPDVSKIMESEPLTFGDIITPLFVVHANRWLSPATEGLLLSSEPLLQNAWTLSTGDSRAQFNGMLQYTAEWHMRPLDFIHYINTRNPADQTVPQKTIGESRSDVLAVEIYPLEKMQMDPITVAALAEDSSVDPFAEVFVKGAAARVKRVLAATDHERALFFDRQAALHRFDPELARAFLAGLDDETFRARMQLANALIEAEKTFLSGQSQSLYDGTYEGDYGQKIRQMISAEFNMLEERRRLARIQNVTTALAVAMLAGSVYGTSVSGTVIASALQNISGVLVLSSVWAISSSLRTRTKSANITEKYMVLMAPELDRQIDVQLEWMESKEQITARGYAEFRDKTGALYQSRVRSLSTTVTDQCSFTHPAVRGEGRWYGACANGKASARGYGLVRDEEGNTVEYLGDTMGGLASGIGAMIVHSPRQAYPTYYEGEFSNGLPDGVVRVSQAGKAASVRKFKAGVDAGKAGEGSWQPMKF